MERDVTVGPDLVASGLLGGLITDERTALALADGQSV